MTALDEYLKLDIEDLKIDLMKRVPDEIGAGYISLTAGVLSGSRGLTPNGNAWYQQKIGPARNAAVAELELEVQKLKLVGGEGATLIERRLEKIEWEHSENTVEATKQFANKYAHVIHEMQDADTSYRRIRQQEGGREAKVPSVGLEYLALLPLVMVPEALLNFQTFRRAPIIQSDFMALGVTILVAVGIAVAAHFFGLYLKQRNFNDPGLDVAKRRAGKGRLWISLTILVMCLAVVAAARYYFLLPEFTKAAVLGLPPPNIYLAVISLLGGNILCFLIGAGFTYALHDENPDYERAGHDKRKWRAAYERHLTKDFYPVKADIEKRRATERRKTENFAAAVRAHPGYGEIANKYGKLKAQDQRVCGALLEYAAALISSGSSATFGIIDISGNPTSLERNMNGAEFAKEPITLY